VTEKPLVVTGGQHSDTGSHIAQRIGRGTRLCKYDGLNPTGSFKDRGRWQFQSKEAGAEAVICASTGNTSLRSSACQTCGNAGVCANREGYVALGVSAGIALWAEVLAIKGILTRR